MVMATSCDLTLGMVVDERGKSFFENKYKISLKYFNEPVFADEDEAIVMVLLREKTEFFSGKSNYTVADFKIIGRSAKADFSHKAGSNVFYVNEAINSVVRIN